MTQQQAERTHRESPSVVARVRATIAERRDRAAEAWRAFREADTTHPAGEAGALWRERVGPVLGVVTGFGWVVVTLTVLALIFGAILQWREVLAMGFVGLALLATAVGFVVGRIRYRIELDLAYTRVVVGERALGRIEIHANSSRVLAPATIEVPVGKAVASFHLPRMAPGDVHEDVFAIPTSRRAVLQVGPVRSVRADPLGLLRRQVKWTDPVDLYVHPRTAQLDETTPGLIRDLEGITTRDLTNSDISFHALRDYVAGDDRRYIHWKSTARTGTLMVRQFEQTRRSVLALGLTTSMEDYADPEELETAISVLGSLGLQAIRDEMDLIVRTSRSGIPSTTGKRLLDGLSGVEWGLRHDRFLDLAQTIGREHAGASVVMLHAGSTVDPATVRRARLLLPTQARVLVFSAAEGRPTVQPLGDATLCTVEDVRALPRVMRGLSLQ